LLFYEIYEDALRPWLPYAILIGWTVLMNVLALLGLKKLEFKGVNQSLPNLRKSPVISNFREDSESESSSVSSHNKHTEDFSSSIDTRLDISSATMRDNGSVESWVEDFQNDFQRSNLGLPVAPVSLVFEDLSFTR
jgi:hypothetical protein